MNRDARLVYSTDPSWNSKAPAPDAAVEGPAGLPPKSQAIKVRREKNGRAGKTVTTLFEFQASDKERENLAKLLRKSLGTGGTVKGNIVELQGDQLEKVLKELAALGYKPRQAGG
jgi:translation initiation factor 1